MLVSNLYPAYFQDNIFHTTAIVNLRHTIITTVTEVILNRKIYFLFSDVFLV